MALQTPLIHCLVDAEPTSFHAADVAGATATFAVNLSFEIPAAQSGTEYDKMLKLADDENDAEAKLKSALFALEDVRFRLFRLNLPSKVNDPFTLTLVPDVDQPSKVSAAGQQSKAEYLHAWLASERRPEQTRYWTSLTQGFAPGLAHDAEDAGAAPRLRAAQAWNAPVAHRQGLTHLLRLKPFMQAGQGDNEGGQSDSLYVALPFFDPNDAVPAEVNVWSAEGKNLNATENLKASDFAEAAVECGYDVGDGLGIWICRTNAVGLVGGEPITSPPPAPPVDDALTPEGFLVVNKDAENIRRFLKAFEERSASIMTAESALHVDGNDDAASLEKLFGFTVIGEAPKDKEVDQRQYHWGPAVWYVMTRLISALDNHVLALLKPVAKKKSWAFNPESEGDVLAPLVSAILDEMNELKPVEDLDGRAIAIAVRQVLRDNSPLVAGGKKPATALVDALLRIFDIANAKIVKADDKDVLDPADPPSVIAKMLAAYRKSGDYDLAPPEATPTFLRFKDKSVANLAATLIDIEQPLYEEAGAERALIRLFETVELNVVTEGKPTDFERLSYRIAEAAVNSDKAEGEERGRPSVELVTAAASGWAKYKALLDGPFNGAEAIRRAVSASFTDALLKAAGEGKKMFDAQRLRDLTSGGHFYAWRLSRAEKNENCFRAMALPLVDAKPVPQHILGELSQRLVLAYTRAVMPLVTAPDPAARFTPDSFPMPLPIQIASGIDGSEIDDFAKAFNGICVAVRRVDEEKSRWAHANLANLRWPVLKANNEKGKALVGAFGALHPMLPAVADGRGPMFIDYEGFPFADAASPERFSNDTSPGAQKLFYEPEPYDYTLADFEKLPRLAYGRAFQSFGFAVSNAGTLPLALQRDVAEPWLPHEHIERLFDGTWTKPDLFDVKYQRRTTIARMAVIEQPAAGMPRRLGESIAGVEPLCADYPRLGVVADQQLPGVIDLFRESDGAARMHLPAKISKPLHWEISELEWSGTPSELVLHLFDRAPGGPGDAGLHSIPIGGELTKIGDLHLVFTDQDEKRQLIILVGTKPYGEPIDLKQVETAFWLRLEVKAAAPTSLSFADPEGKRPAGDAAPLVLFPPEGKGSKVWRNDLPNTITVRVSTPRVGYLNFMRWMANTTLRDKAYTIGGDEFERVLLTAYMMRHLDARLAQQLDNLPDPSVSAIGLELLATDRLTGKNVVPKTDKVDLSQRLAGFVAGMPGIVAALTKELTDKKLSLSPFWTPERLLSRIFKPLDETFSFTVRLTAGAFDFTTDAQAKSTILTAIVPSGTVAQLSMHVLVQKSLFDETPRQDDNTKTHPAVLHMGLKQFATRVTSDDHFLSYPASAIRIETMHNGIDSSPNADVTKWISAAEAMIEAVPLSTTRRFDLKTHDVLEKGHYTVRAMLNDWRLIGEIDVTTQRWRASGRPIYNFINPRAHARNGKTASGPALPILLGKDEAVEQFESEAFFDRPDIDANTVTQRLAPLGTRTVLQQFSWDSPSATYFRHRFTLRSRYAGALLQESRRSVDAWPREPILKEHAWTKRVAMLADASRLILTRPQLRALIPLTTAPGGEGLTTPTPPIAAILQEPPYSRGGLADRIAPELKTGFGYGFEEGKQGTTDKPPVEILDSRKEIGPNPQLSYSPFEYEQVLGLCLRGEGPLGLTFDMPDTPAPAFANTMLSLRPISLVGSEPAFEEALMGVAMRRYLDPDWLTSPTVSAGDVKPVEGVPPAKLNLPADRTWWVEVNTNTADIAGVAETGVLLKVASVGEVDGFTGVEVWKESVDKVKGYIKETTLVAKAQSSRIDGLVLLHQPIAPGRYSTSVFARTKSASVADGDSSAPMILASFEWSLPVAEKVDGEKRQGAAPIQPAVLKITGSDIVARETMASATTSLRWTQISRDFDLLRVAGEEKPYLARNLVSRLEDKLLKFDLVKGKTDVAMLPSTQGNRYPSHVHRHIGFITSRFLRELGRPVETFCGTALAAGPATVLFETEGASQAVRVVEFETPASIVCQQDLAAPDTYRKAYFDLVSTGYKSENDLLLTLRFVGSQQHLSQFSGVTVLLSQPVDPGPAAAAGKTEKNTIHIPVKPTKDVWPVGARIILRPEAPEKVPRLEAWIVFSDGLEKPTGEKAELDLNLSGNYPGFMLSLQAEGSKAEFWTDVSLLHCKQNANELTAAAGKPPGPAVAFHFDWLFGQVERSSEPATQVGPSRLAGMTEAQARIVSVSPPISIISKGP